MRVFNHHISSLFPRFNKCWPVIVRVIRPQQQQSGSNIRFSILLHTKSKNQVTHNRVNPNMNKKTPEEQKHNISQVSNVSTCETSKTDNKSDVTDDRMNAFNFDFDDSDFEKIKISRDVLKERAEKMKNDLEIWKEIKSQNLGKGDFPNLKICFQPVTDSFNALRNRPLVDVTSVFSHNAWDHIEWDDEMKSEAEKKIQSNSAVLVPDEKKQVLENEASSFWNQFYGIHQNKFFKERNWLFTEFPELKSPFGCSVDPELSRSTLITKRQNEAFPGENSSFRVLEIGCGNGSTVFPLLSMNNNPELFVYCCDFAPSAVNVVKNSPKFESNRCLPFVWDVTTDVSDVLPLESLDVIVLIFVMSAISPDKFDKVLNNFYKLLKPGGLILFRDYGKYDLVQLRFGEGRCISENFYVRGDGTRVYFFDKEEVEDLFQRNGFVTETINIDKRLQVNRLKQLKMYRIWILGKYRKL